MLHNNDEYIAYYKGIIEPRNFICIQQEFGAMYVVTDVIVHWDYADC